MFCAVDASSALQVEIQALTLALNHLLKPGRVTEKVIIDSDCKTLVEAVNDPYTTPWEVRSLLAEVVALLPCFSQLQLRFRRRETNTVADWAAKAHLRGSLPSNWAANPPSILLDLLVSDAIAAGCKIS